MTENPYIKTVADACAIASCSRVTLNKWIKAGLFPAPRRIGTGKNGRVRWCQADFDTWVAGLCV
jgi:predicted DNA-binding transcriptional regulator AlpA